MSSRYSRETGYQQWQFDAKYLSCRVDILYMLSRYVLSMSVHVHQATLYGTRRTSHSAHVLVGRRLPSHSLQLFSAGSRACRTQFTANLQCDYAKVLLERGGRISRRTVTSVTQQMIGECVLYPLAGW